MCGDLHQDLKSFYYNQDLFTVNSTSKIKLHCVDAQVHLVEQLWWHGFFVEKASTMMITLDEILKRCTPILEQRHSNIYTQSERWPAPMLLVWQVSWLVCFVEKSLPLKITDQNFISFDEILNRCTWSRHKDTVSYIPKSRTKIYNMNIVIDKHTYVSWQYNGPSKYFPAFIIIQYS